MTLNHSECGKLGGAVTKAKLILVKRAAIESYYTQPVICKECGLSHSYEKRKNKFCSMTCSAKYNNRARCKKYNKCGNCGELVTNKYCSHECEQEFRFKERIENWQNAENAKSNPRLHKKFLAEKYGYRCSICNISEWNKKSICLELEHKDGNSNNNKEENLCLICPNCHSQTDTYKGKNKGNGRHNRMERYKAGLSY